MFQFVMSADLFNLLHDHIVENGQRNSSSSWTHEGMIATEYPMSREIWIGERGFCVMDEDPDLGADGRTVTHW